MLLDENGDPGSLPDVLERFGDRPWSWVLEDFAGEAEFWHEPVAVRVYPSGHAAEQPLETGDGPYLVVVEGDLTTTVHAELWTGEGAPGLVIVTGDLCASALSFGNGARVVVEGGVRLTGACVGRFGDLGAALTATGELSARALLLDGAATARAARGIRALIYASGEGWERLRPDIVNDGRGDDSRFFRPELLRDTETGPRLHFPEALRAALDGGELFLPGVEERFPARLVARRDAG